MSFLSVADRILYGGHEVIIRFEGNESSVKYVYFKLTKMIDLRYVSYQPQ